MCYFCRPKGIYAQPIGTFFNCVIVATLGDVDKSASYLIHNKLHTTVRDSPSLPSEGALGTD
jgi:hypothetical protein